MRCRSVPCAVPIVLFVCVISAPAISLEVTQDVTIEGSYTRVFIAPDTHGAIEDFTVLATGHNIAGRNGLLEEGFGVPNMYSPARRLNERLEIVESSTDRPILRFSYDCQGPNVEGLHSERILEPLLNESGMKVRWRLENKGPHPLWLTPWVRNEAAPGGTFDDADRVDIPSLDGLRAVSRSRYMAAARNWAAATDPAAKETVYGVFHADHTFAFLGLRDRNQKYSGFQTAFTPRLLKPGEIWETFYRVNAVRGLQHVDFATDELAAQLDYAAGAIELRLAPVKALPEFHIEARVVLGDKVWKLPAKKFTLTPGQVIRCTYPWTPPADGTYEFLAQVQLAGKPYRLGQETGSPHGGIDTQFTVGKKPGPMEAWTDAPHALDIGPREYKRDFASLEPRAWFESSLDKVFQSDNATPAGRVAAAGKISLARNERESLQLVFRPGETMRNVTINVRDLKTDAGAVLDAANVSLYRVGYTPVRTSTHFEGPTGLWPDPLFPIKPFSAPANQCTPIWITLYAPPHAEPGTYSGIIEVGASGLDPLEFWLEVEVYNFTLPQAPALKTAFGYWPESALRAARTTGYTGNQAALDQAWFKNAIEHRITLSGLADLPAPTGDYRAALAAFGPKLDTMINAGATTIGVPAELLHAGPGQLEAADEFVRARKLEGRIFSQVSDEPPPPAWPKIYESLNLWNERAPSIPAMCTTIGLQPFLSDALDIWTIHAPMLDTANNKVILDRVREGREVWWYVNHSPGRPYANFFLDFSSVEHRVPFWHTWALGFRGMYYWLVNYVEEGDDPYLGALDLVPTNGDGLLVYPGPDGPINSIRWENIRDGVDDFDYLTLLQKSLAADSTSATMRERGARALDLKAIIPDLVAFTRDSAVIESKRREIGELLSELRASGR